MKEVEQKFGTLELMKGENLLRYRDSAGRKFTLDCEKCAACIDFDFSYAFQPIVDLDKQEIFGYEALVRGVNNEPAGEILSRINEKNRYAFDQICRQKAIRIASELGLDKVLSINFLPNAVYQPEHCIQSTLRAANEVNFPTHLLMFEVTESEEVVDRKHLTNIFRYYQAQGFIVALDDFGAGHAGLNMLASFVPQILKIDRELIHDIDSNPVKQVIVRHLVQTCQELNVTVLAEGVETREELDFIRTLGVSLYQGYLFAKPGFESLPVIDDWSVYL
ncbi:EAL domain-containing protein [Thiomicrorhabdus sp. 6S3-12]|uniref:EAL domain-containing protein n=1 Tax=Thiomicrorhabdus sp. 6S3-12 TaxID=2819681 RepID=UPI0035302E69